MIKKIEPQKNNLITFLSSPNSLHGVESIIQTDHKKYFSMDYKKLIKVLPKNVKLAYDGLNFLI
mgnify:FL=1|tara:strand:+ start:3720 stop:3911 length:192 start_codon:yes stop_codon:yes gene_type:complete